MKTIKTLLLTILALILLVIPVMQSRLVYAVDPATPTSCNGLGDPKLIAKCEVCQGAGLDNCSDTSKGTQIDSVLVSVVNLLSIIVGIVSVIMIIVGGLKYITSTGESGKVTGAKNTITYALIGLVIALLSQILIKFVIGKVI